MDHAPLTGLNGVLIKGSLRTKATAFGLIDDKRCRTDIMKYEVVGLWLVMDHAVTKVMINRFKRDAGLGIRHLHLRAMMASRKQKHE